MPSSDTIELTTAAGTRFEAFYMSPAADQRLPAVIYNHGKLVADEGYAGAVAQGYDVKDFARALRDAGYVSFVPIRGRGSQFSDGVLLAALEYLKSRPNVNRERIFMIGFSEGGLFTLQAAITYPDDLAAFVLMSPAPGEGSDSFASTNTTPNLQRITAPAFVTLGAREPNAAIVSNVRAFTANMRALGKSIDSRLDYPGDHAWFYQVRPQYWPDVLAFLARRS